MNKKILLCSVLVFVCYMLNAQEKVLRKGMIITENTKIKKAIYKLDADQNYDRPVILIEGYNITVDFNNATLQGSITKKNPDEFFGVAIIISDKSNHVTIKNLKAK